MPNFILLGCAGYVAPKHMKAIKDCGGELIAAVDPHDSVGILDSYFPRCSFFTEFERFDRHCDKLIRSGTPIDYVSICSPNYLHDAHARFALRIGADAICEKPLALKERNLLGLRELEQESGRSINCILQLRLNEQLIQIKNDIRDSSSRKRVNLIYVTPRGEWYLHSWKGNEEKSGGLATNIGIHLFDLIVWMFGELVAPITLSKKTKKTVSGIVSLQKADVCFTLSVEGASPCRKMEIDGEEIEFSKGFTDLHSESYRQILLGNGFGIDDALPSIRICEQIRDM